MNSYTVLESDEKGTAFRENTVYLGRQCNTAAETEQKRFFGKRTPQDFRAACISNSEIIISIL